MTKLLADSRRSDDDAGHSLEEVQFAGAVEIDLRIDRRMVRIHWILMHVQPPPQLRWNGAPAGLPLRPSALTGNKEQVDDLTDEKQAAGEDPDDAGDPSAGVEAVDAAEADEAQAPEQIGNAGRGVDSGRHGVSHGLATRCA